MTNLPKIAISVGDLNGIGIEIALKCHEEISKICKPIIKLTVFPTLFNCEKIVIIDVKNEKLGKHQWQLNG